MMAVFQISVLSILLLVAHTQAFALDPVITRLNIHPYKCNAGAKICNADCRAAADLICKNSPKDTPRQNHTVGGCVASYFNAYTTLDAVTPPNFVPTNPTVAACQAAFEILLNSSTSGPDCTVNRRFGGIALNHTSSNDTSPGSSVLYRLEPTNAQPCCYAQENCDPNKIFGQHVDCGPTYNGSLSTRGLHSTDLVRLDRRKWHQNYGCDEAWAAAVTFGPACMMSLLLSANPISAGISAFVCLAGLFSYLLFGFICVADKLADNVAELLDGGRRRTRRSIGPSMSTSSSSNQQWDICSSVPSPAFGNRSDASVVPQCLQSAVSNACQANDGKLDPSKIFVSSS